ncbi:MAG: FKBP-type peptidyl-prolyl cis-trans isomerase [Pseudomonadota bacterium]
MNRVQPNSLVTLKYTMGTHLPDGSVKDHPEEQLDFIFGVERQVPALEKALEGRKVGDRVNLKIPDSELYGPHDPDLIREIPREGLISQRLKEGQFYRQIRKGGLVSFKTLEIKPKTVLVDFNKPMSGIRVSMEVEVLGVREANEGEIEVAKKAEYKKSIGCE